MKLQGRDQEAREQFERVLVVANDLGLLAEEYNVPRRHLAGNFPQAQTHLAVLNAALAFSGPALRRGRKDQTNDASVGCLFPITSLAQATIVIERPCRSGSRGLDTDATSHRKWPPAPVLKVGRRRRRSAAGIR